MAKAWMPMYWGDYLADTQYFSRADHGAYLLLIAFYWCNGGLPNDDDLVRRIAKCSNGDWPKLKAILSSKFQEGWKHKRIDAELAQALERSNRARSNSNARWHRSGNANHNHNHKDKKDISSLRSDDGWPIDYKERFWAKYPKKVGKGAVFRKLEVIRKSGEIPFDRLLSAISEIKASDPKFIPHPITWLNQGRYLDHDGNGVVIDEAEFARLKAKHEEKLARQG